MNGVVPPASQPVPEGPTSAPVATVFQDGGASGAVARVEQPFGNLITSFVEADFRSIGIAAGKSFQLRCRDNTFNVLLGRGFGDVPSGEWVAFLTAQGTFRIARNLANAAETSGCMAGDSLFVSQRQ